MLGRGRGDSLYPGHRKKHTHLPGVSLSYSTLRSDRHVHAFVMASRRPRLSTHTPRSSRDRPRPRHWLKPSKCLWPKASHHLPTASASLAAHQASPIVEDPNFDSSGKMRGGDIYLNLPAMELLDGVPPTAQRLGTARSR